MRGLDWGSELWVKVFTRDTLEFRILGPIERSIVVLLMRKVDRNGEIELGDSTPEDGVVALLDFQSFASEAARATQTLISRGWVAVDGTKMSLPWFVESQDTPSTSTGRSRKRRWLGINTAVLPNATEDSVSVAECNAALPNATDSTSAVAVCAHENRREETRIEEKRVDGFSLEVQASGPKPRKTTPQERFAQYFYAEREVALGEDFIEDKEIPANRINGDLAWITEHAKELVAEAVSLYLQDPYRRGQHPPCSLRWFSSDRAEYLSKAKKAMQ